MEIIVKHFSELSTKELYEILKLRVDVFVVEQNCPYPEIDGNDENAYHVFMKDDEGIQAYLRVLPPKTTFPEIAIGRVIAKKRRCGLGSKLMQEGIRVAQEQFESPGIRIEAQVYARKFYENLGFQQTSQEFLEDGIAHIEMYLAFE